MKDDAVSYDNTNKKAACGESEAISLFTRRGWEVAPVLFGASKVDLVVICPTTKKSFRVQVKTVVRKGKTRNLRYVNLCTGQDRHLYEPDDFDLLFIVDVSKKGKPCWLFDWESIRKTVKSYNHLHLNNIDNIGLYAAEKWEGFQCPG